MATGRRRVDSMEAIVGRVADFAAENIATRPGLSSDMDFPHDLWRDMARSGFLGIGVPEENGGSGLGYPGISAAGRALARRGRCLGITLSWLMHQIVSRFPLCTFASSGQRKAYLTAMASGGLTASIAISEPGAGGHPRHLKTSVVRTSEGYILKGEKTFLTNGPIADLFVVLAASGHDGDRRRFSAFLVPRGSAGLTVTGPMDVGFLRPCQHGGILLDGCMVPEESLIGSPGTAYEDMAVPFRDVEDTAMMGPLLGAQEARFDDIVQELREKGDLLQEETAYRLGGLYSSLGGLEVLARESALLLEDEGVSESLLPLVMSFRSQFVQVHTEMSEIASMTDLHPSESWHALSHDLDHVVNFAGRVSRLKQIKLGAGIASGGSMTGR